MSTTGKGMRFGERDAAPGLKRCCPQRSAKREAVYECLKNGGGARDGGMRRRRPDQGCVLIKCVQLLFQMRKRSGWGTGTKNP